MSVVVDGVGSWLCHPLLYGCNSSSTLPASLALSPRPRSQSSIWPARLICTRWKVCSRCARKLLEGNRPSALLLKRVGEYQRRCTAGLSCFQENLREPGCPCSEICSRPCPPFLKGKLLKESIKGLGLPRRPVIDWTPALGWRACPPPKSPRRLH